MAEHDPLQSLLGRQLWRAASIIKADLAERLAELSLGGVEASIMIVLGSQPFLTQSEICRRLNINRPNMTLLAAGLIARGLIEKAAADGRHQPLKLTAEGATLAAQARERMVLNDERFFGRLTAEDRKGLQATLTVLCYGHDNSGRQPAPPNDLRLGAQRG